MEMIYGQEEQAGDSGQIDNHGNLTCRIQLYIRGQIPRDSLLKEIRWLFTVKQGRAGTRESTEPGGFCHAVFQPDNAGQEIE